MTQDKQLEPVSRDYTVNLAKRLHGVQFKKKAPKALKVLKKFAFVNMKTEVREISSIVKVIKLIVPRMSAFTRS